MNAIEVYEEPEVTSITPFLTGGRHITGQFRDWIFDVEKAIGTIPGAIFGDTDAAPLKHSFANGICVREIFLPKGSLLTGKIHREDHPNFILSGEVTVVTEFSGIERLKAPVSMISKAGTKRLVFCHEDTWWVTIHRTEETDGSKITETITVLTYEEFENLLKEKR